MLEQTIVSKAMIKWLELVYVMITFHLLLKEMLQMVLQIYIFIEVNASANQRKLLSAPIS